MNNGETCDVCKFGKHTGPNFAIDCHRRAPIPTLTKSGDVESHWPATSTSDWCGEFEKGVDDNSRRGVPWRDHMESESNG